MTDLEELKKLAEVRDFMEHQLIIARMELAKWQNRLLLGQFKVVKVDNE